MNKLVAITIDYETWQPIPPGKTINWDNDIFIPTVKLLDICDKEGIKLTLMAEMGEYFWVKQNAPEIAEKMEKQWQDAISRGHDVQLHLHPSWLPELGAKCEGREWSWDWTKSKCHDYPGSLIELIGKCKNTLESILRPIDPQYRTVAFRAGAYQVQPFRRLYEALTANNIICDSSVYSGGISKERGYDFSLAYSNHQPYFANAYDPQLKAPPSEKRIVEIPILTFKPSQRLFLDGEDGKYFPVHLLNLEKETSTFSKNFLSLGQRLKKVLSGTYYRLRRFHPFINPILPKKIAYSFTHYAPERLTSDDYFVFIGHTKGILYPEEISGNIRRLKKTGQYTFVTLSEMALKSQKELSKALHANPEEESSYQVKREYEAVMGNTRNARQSYYLQNIIPLDRQSVLDLGCGTGYWTHRIAHLYPWMKITGVDFGQDFISRAKEKFGHEQIYFQADDFSHLSFPSESFECVYADNSLEHAYDVDKTLSEIYRVLKCGGVLIAAIPSDARNPKKICDNHTWKTAPHEVFLRLYETGFVNMEIEEIDTFRKLGMPPFPPSNDKMMYIKAWKRRKEASAIDRALEIMSWVYHHLSPEEPHQTSNPKDILTQGYAWCDGYARVAQHILEKEHFKTRIVSFFMKDHPRGHGQEKIDSHTLVEVKINGKYQLFDPTCNIYFNGFSLKELANNPSLAEPIFKKHNPDKRFEDRQYALYCTEWAFKRCFKITRENRFLSRIKRLLIPCPQDFSSPMIVKKTALMKELKSKERQKEFRHKGLLLQCENINAIKAKDISEIILCLYHIPWQWIDAKGSKINHGPFLVNLLNLIRDFFLWPLIYIKHRLGINRLRAQTHPCKIAPNNKSVLFLRTDHWFNIKSGGSVGHLSGVIGGLRELGYKAHVVSTDYLTGIDPKNDFYCCEPAYGIGQNIPDFPEILYTNQLIKFIKDRWGQWNPSFIYQRYSFGNYAGVVLKHLFKIPYICEYNGSFIWMEKHWGKNKIFHKTLIEKIELLNLRTADVVVVVSQPMADELTRRKILPERILVNPNGVDPQKYHPHIDGIGIRQKYNLGNKVVVGFIGTFGHWHGAEVLAKSVKEVVQRNPNIHFLFIGDGLALPQVKDIVVTAGVQNFATFTGLIPQEEGPQYLAACDILASPHVPNPDGSPFFGSPTKLFEYMAMGKAIIASRLEQIADVLQNNHNALLVEPNNIEELTLGIIKLAQDSSLRNHLGYNAREEVLSKYTWKKNVERVIERLQLLNNKS